MKIYFVQEGESGPVKIGRTRNVKARLSCLQTGNPHPLNLRLVINRSDPKLESKIHNGLDYLHIRGEWYRCEDELKQLLGWASYCDHARMEQYIHEYFGNDLVRKGSV